MAADCAADSLFSKGGKIKGVFSVSGYTLRFASDAAVICVCFKNVPIARRESFSSVIRSAGISSGVGFESFGPFWWLFDKIYVEMR